MSTRDSSPRATMVSARVAFVLQLVVLAATGQLVGVVESSTHGRDSEMPTGTIGLEGTTGGITARLIHRDQYLADPDVNWDTERAKRDRDARRRTRMRVEALFRRTLLEGGAPSPAPDLAAPPVAGSNWETPLSDITQSEYLMEISLGTPPQTFLAIADTGSDLTWLECNQRSGGGSSFQTHESSTYSRLSCNSTACKFLGNVSAETYCDAYDCAYTYRYADQTSTSGYVIQDSITVQQVQGGNQTVADFWFGCSYTTASSIGFSSVTQGLVGLGRGAISFPSQLGTNFGQKFGYCLVNRSISDTFAYSSPLYFGSAAELSTPGGELQVQYSPLILNPKLPSFYYVGCAGITLNAAPVIQSDLFNFQGDGTGGLLFDSGTTYTILWQNIYGPLTQAIQQHVTKYTVTVLDNDNKPGAPLCYHAQWSDWVNDYGQAVPNMTFLLSNTSGFDLAVDTAWRQVDGSTVCLAMQGTGSSNYDFNIFGSYQQVGYQILYDLGKSEIGFVKANCSVTNTGLHLDNGSTSLHPRLLPPLALLLLVLALLA